MGFRVAAAAFRRRPPPPTTTATTRAHQIRKTIKTFVYISRRILRFELLFTARIIICSRRQRWRGAGNYIVTARWLGRISTFQPHVRRDIAGILRHSNNVRKKMFKENTTRADRQVLPPQPYLPTHCNIIIRTTNAGRQVIVTLNTHCRALYVCIIIML